MTLFLDFVHTLLRYALHVREVIATLLMLIVLGGFVVSMVEGINPGNAVYFAFITALSVGYGDICPQTCTGRIVSVCVGLIGMLFVGVTVACATRALADTSKRHMQSRH